MSKTKTITLGKDSIVDLLKILEQHKNILLQEEDNFKLDRKTLNKTDSFISLLKMTPWNEGGYCDDELA